MSQSSFTSSGRMGVRPEIWVVVADAGRARILQAIHTDGQLLEQEDLLNPAARLQEHDAVSDRKGHVTQGSGGGGQSFEPRHTQADHGADQFAKDLCRRLQAGRQQGRVGKIYLIAEASFLGHLRKHMETATQAIIVAEIASDLSRQPIAHIRKALPVQL